MNRNMIETVLGAVVLLAAALFLGFAYNSADLNKAKEGYLLSADFDRLDGLKPGSDVRMNGVLVGSVRSVALDKNTYRATAVFSVNSDIKLPTDTNAQVASESLLGGKYLSLDVGVEEQMVPTDGKGKLTRTTPPMRLDDLIGQLIYNKQDSKKTEGTSGQMVTPTAAPPKSAEPALPAVPPSPPGPAAPAGNQ
ncbi:MAG: outer membrane lipid asymmetry maintenance protein MlaD [Proteobacteria bacterium]|nr:outer membrane lipid asymmetry maintenance protein MlaD [Pseudomonadota bacterium]